MGPFRGPPDLKLTANQPRLHPLHQMKLSARSLESSLHKTLAAATGRRTHATDPRSFGCHVCADDLTLGISPEGPNPHVQWHVINIFILVVHKLRKLKLSKSGLPLPTSFPRKKSVPPASAIIIIREVTHPNPQDPRSCSQPLGLSDPSTLSSSRSVLLKRLSGLSPPRSPQRSSTHGTTLYKPPHLSSRTGRFPLKISRPLSLL